MALTLRQNINRALTNNELDDNFIFLNGKIDTNITAIDLLNNTTIPALELSIDVAVDGKQDYSNKLTSLSALTTPGLLSLVSTVNGTVASRSIVGSANIVVTNGSGVDGNPTISTSADVLTATNVVSVSNKVISGNNNTLESISVNSLIGTLPISKGGTGSNTDTQARINLGVMRNTPTNGIVVRTAADVTAAREITVSGSGISITNGTGVAGNPVITLDSSVSAPSTLVLRDGSGNFAANIITASLSGNATSASTVTNGVYTTGSYANPAWITSLAGSKITSLPNSSLQNSSITINGTAIPLGGSTTINVTGTPTNTGSTIVSRDGSGNFAANIITASLNGNANYASSADISNKSIRLNTARNINGVAFDGTQDITVLDSTKLSVSGGTMGGYITLHATPINALHAANKGYIDSAISSIPSGIKAWVTFNGVNGGILGSYNVTSVSVTGSGKYQINIPNGVLSNGNYAVSGMASDVDHLVTFNNASATTLVVYTTDTHADSNNATSTTQGRVMIMISGD